MGNSLYTNLQTIYTSQRGLKGGSGVAGGGWWMQLKTLLLGNHVPLLGHLSFFGGLKGIM